MESYGKFIQPSTHFLENHLVTKQPFCLSDQVPLLDAASQCEIVKTTSSKHNKHHPKTKNMTGAFTMTEDVIPLEKCREFSRFWQISFQGWYLKEEMCCQGFRLRSNGPRLCLFSGRRERAALDHTQAETVEISISRK